MGLPQLRPQRLPLLRLLTLPPRDFPTVMAHGEVWDTLDGADMLDTAMELDTHTLVPTLVPMPVTHTLDILDTHMPHSSPTPTVPSSPLSPLMLSLPVPTTWLPMLKK